MRGTIGPPTITINYDHEFLVCQADGTMLPTDDVGFFSRDTRLVSGYRLTLNRLAPILLDAAEVAHFSARHEFITPAMPLGSASGVSAELTDLVLPERAIGLRLDRTILEGIHEDYDLLSFAKTPVRLVLEVALESDFADVFDVRSHRLVRRGDLQTLWRPSSGELRTTYRNGDFRRELVVRVAKGDSHPEFANGRLVWIVTLAPKGTWHVCLEWRPVIGRRLGRVLDCHAMLRKEAGLGPRVLPRVELESPHPTLPAIWRQSVRDLEALRMTDFTVRRSVYVPAAGIPWYVTLFGRDTLVVAMESISGFPEFASGALDQLARFQAKDDNPDQDKEPGKIPHEVRFGELASLNLLPFAPYYGTHDATPLYLIVLSYAYQWSGETELLTRYRANAEAALTWVLQHGDRDGDGFQEYISRSRHGLYNQGWKDSGDAIQHEDGTIAPVPLALCELQGYAFDALLRMSEMCHLWGEDERSEELRRQALALYERFNETFWWESEGTYYLGLDAHKQPIRTVASKHRGIQCRPLLGQRHRPTGPRPARGGSPDAAGHVERVGSPHAVQRPSELQPPLLSPRFRLAARQRHHRRRFPASGPPCRSAAHRRGDLRGRRAVRVVPAAGALQRATPRAQRLPSALPGLQCAAGVGRGVDLPAGGHPLRDPHRREYEKDLRQPGPAGLAPLAHPPQSAGWPRGAGPAPAA